MKLKKNSYFLGWIILIILILFLAFFLRFWKLSVIPPSLGWDEASLGYNAYSILKTGKDEHGEFMPMARFIAFGDYKPPGYIYMTVPFIALLGLSELAVRFPSALTGSLAVLITYFLVKELFRFNNKSQVKRNERWVEIIALLSSLLLAVSPWSVMLSRVAFEANLAFFFNLLGVYFLIKAYRKSKLLFLSSLFFIFSFYTFNANRIIAPLLFGGLLILVFGKKLLKIKKEICLSFLIWVVLLLPSFSYLRSPESKLRLKEVSIFNNLEPLKLSNQRIKLDGGGLLARIIHNRRLAYLKVYLVGYFKTFSGRFLFIQGDKNPRFSTGELGNLYLIELPFLLLGAYHLLKKRRKIAKIIFFWMFVVPIPAAFAKEVPHALRTVSLLPTFQIVSGFGAAVFFKSFKKKKIIYLWGALLGVFFFFNVFYFIHDYFIHYPKWSCKEWQYGYKQIVKQVAVLEDKYDQVVVTETAGRPYIYFLFYLQYDPEKYWRVVKKETDTFGLVKVKAVAKYKFGLENIQENERKTLVVLGGEENIEGFSLLETIYFLDGTKAFKIGEV